MNGDETADAELISAIHERRSEDAFRRLYRRHSKALYAFALHLTCSESDAQDLLQETWVTAVERLRAFRGGSRFRTWLFGVAINIDRNAGRRAARRRASSLDAEESLPAQDHESADHASDIIGAYMDITAALRHLSAGYRRVLVLHDIEGYRHDEIAELLGIAVGTSKSQLHHARRSVRRYLSHSENPASQSEER